MQSPVPANRLQERLKKQDLEALSPGTGTRHLAAGVLLEVYDREYLEQITLDTASQQVIDTAPGLMFARVLLSTGNKLLLPFRDPEDYIHLIYGNYLMLVGRQVRVEFEAMNIESGQILLSRTYDQAQLNVAKQSTAYDIGVMV